jgi:hypothetical protein
MKKIITFSALVTLLLSGVQADFTFGDVFKDLKKSEIAKSPSTDFVFGDVFKDLKKPMQ